MVHLQGYFCPPRISKFACSIIKNCRQFGADILSKKMQFQDNRIIFAEMTGCFIFANSVLKSYDLPDLVHVFYEQLNFFELFKNEIRKTIVFVIRMQ